MYRICEIDMPYGFKEFQTQSNITKHQDTRGYILLRHIGYPCCFIKAIQPSIMFNMPSL